MFLDCTLRDGGYYNAWDFSTDLIELYLDAMKAAGVDVVELGFRSLSKKGFMGPCAYATDEFIASIKMPSGLTVGVMLNASELVGEVDQLLALKQLFPNPASKSPVKLVRIACHLHEFESVLPAVLWLKEYGYQVGINIMQAADRTELEVKAIGRQASEYPIDVLYFADSMGSMGCKQVSQIISWFRAEWDGPLGIHGHDNLGLALTNTISALDEGVEWVDSTVSGMGRGPGNARTEELAIEVASRRAKVINLVPLVILLRSYFKPMQNRCGWGTNPYYYLAGKYGIHPTYIQEMLNDKRYSDEDVFAIIESLRLAGGKTFSHSALGAARHFYSGASKGSWSPKQLFAGREVLLLGAGPGVARHREALERYIRIKNPIVLTLNTRTDIDVNLIDLSVASHPLRLLVDCEIHSSLPQPLITPYSMLPENIRDSLVGKKVFDFGIEVRPNTFAFNPTNCTLPTSLVAAYALAVATSGEAIRVLMAGFDGYGAEDLRSTEMSQLLEKYQESKGALSLIAITPTCYPLHSESVYAL